MQNLVSDILLMERGQSKAVTGKEHQERNDFIIGKQKEVAKLTYVRQCGVWSNEQDTLTDWRTSSHLDYFSVLSLAFTLEFQGRRKMVQAELPCAYRFRLDEPRNREEPQAQ